MTKTQRRATFDRIDALSRILNPSVHERRWLLEARRAIHSDDLRLAIARGDKHAEEGSYACRANVDAQLARLNREAITSAPGNSQDGSWTRAVYPVGGEYREPVKD